MLDNHNACGHDIEQIFLCLTRKLIHHHHRHVLGSLSDQFPKETPFNTSYREWNERLGERERERGGTKAS
jgi:hypothetical protein